MKNLVKKKGLILLGIIGITALAGFFYVDSTATNGANVDIAGNCASTNVAIDNADIAQIRSFLQGGSAQYPRNCDANGDTVLDAADVICASRLATGQACHPANFYSSMGTNLSSVNFYSSEYPFVDAFKTGLKWIPKTTGYARIANYEDLGIVLDLDSNGWPRSLPNLPDNASNYIYSWLIMDIGRALEAHYPAGDYTILYDGEGALEYIGVTKNEALSVHGRDIISLPANHNGFEVQLVQTDPNNNGNYLRNIRVLMPGFDETNYRNSQFHPDFIQSIESFKVLRFMDWMRTNYLPTGERLVPEISAQTPEYLAQLLDQVHVDGHVVRTTELNVPLKWEDRPLPANHTYGTSDGIPVEVMVALVNETQTDPWFTFPHNVTNDYVTQFSKHLRDTLEPEKTMYIEYSNEVWNEGFGQKLWLNENARLEWNLSGLGARMQWYGKRSAEICESVKAEWGAEAERVVCVLSGQSANTWVLEQALSCPSWSEAPCANHQIDAIAIAPYFGQHIGHSSFHDNVEPWRFDADGGTARVLNEILYGDQLPPNSSIITNVNDTAENITKHKALADEYGLDLISYEGGQHLVRSGPNLWGLPQNERDAIDNMFVNANNDQKMVTIYNQYLTGWKAAGGGLFMHFNNTHAYSQYGMWGAQEFYNEPTRPKYDAIQSFIRNNPCTDCALPEGIRPAQLNLGGFVNGTQADVTVAMSSNNHDISGLAFTIKYDPSRLTFDETDNNGDRLPDNSVRLDSNISAFVTQISDDNNGNVRVTITDSESTPTVEQFANTVLLTLTFTATAGDDVLQFANETSSFTESSTLSCSNVYGQAIPCAASGRLGVPATGLPTPSPTEVPKPTPTPDPTAIIESLYIYYFPFMAKN